MASIEQVISNFSQQTGKYTKGSRGREGCLNIYYEGRILYSYGYHFPLAIRHEDADDAVGFGCGIKYIINGDKYSVSTSSHQNECIKVLNPNVQIPFSALQQAWNWTQGDEGWFYPKDNPDEHLTQAQMKEKFPERNGNYYGIGYYWRDNPDWVRSFNCLAEIIKSGTPKFQIVDYRKDTWRHSHDEGKTWKEGYGGTDYNLPEDQRDQCVCGLPLTIKDKLKVEHKLGAVLLKINDKYFLSSFDEIDRGNYFLCHVSGEPGSVDEAYENLKPMEVKKQEASGGIILRQGDWFFLPVAESTKPLLKAFTPSQVSNYRLGSNTSGTHVVTRAREIPKAVGGEGIYVQGCVRHSPRDGRRPEHKRLKLGDGKSWWIPVKNASEAGWGAVGNVD